MPIMSNTKALYPCPQYFQGIVFKISSQDVLNMKEPGVLYLVKATENILLPRTGIVNLIPLALLANWKLHAAIVSSDDASKPDTTYMGIPK